MAGGVFTFNQAREERCVPPPSDALAEFSRETAAWIVCQDNPLSFPVMRLIFQILMEPCIGQPSRKPLLQASDQLTERAKHFCKARAE